MIHANTLKQMGLKLRIIYDETVYISSAISLVQQNIYWRHSGYWNIVVIYA